MMEIRAMHGEDEVVIIDIKAGSPKDCKEILIVYYYYPSGVMGFECGDEEILANFTVIG